VTGETYMINQDEELWAKDLPPAVEVIYPYLAFFSL
jgi:hypothetical protein